MEHEEWIEFLEVVHGTICKGVYVGDLANPKYNHLETMRPDRLVEECMKVVGKEAKMPRPVLNTDTSDDYAKALRDSPHWEEIIPVEGENFYPLLKDHDLLTWAYSDDGTEGCNQLPGLDGGNTSVGFLIQAGGSYPTVIHPLDTESALESGVLPLDVCFKAKERDGLKAKLIYIHRRIE
jgi:hypothetical protein